MIKTILPLVFAVLLFACGKTPEACFTPEESTIDFGTTFTLTNCSKGGSVINVDWGDGVFEQEGMLSHLYTVPSTYNVNITVMTANQKKYDETSVTVTVSEPDVNQIQQRWQQYKAELFTSSANEQLTQALTNSNVQGTDLDKESTYSLEVDFIYNISSGSVSVTNADGETETSSWYPSNGGIVYMDGAPYQVVKLTSNEMILRANDLSQFDKYDANNEYPLENVEGYVLLYFRR